ncbi:MAG: class II fructose-bisphosphate aldolase [Coriobacteriia bacterium]|nr:class II fructose-bisphosphate aldolase [Coriobacteriia bacterium]MCL2750315.1 class II fructose-bisphosphate aldolase [Coriobacteriia bacterium]
MSCSTHFEEALKIGRAPNIQELFPDSKALIVSGKVIDRAMNAKGKSIAMAANGRNSPAIAGALLAAQKANAAIIIEIAKSESTYCGINFWNIASVVNTICNTLNITIPVAIHADHYTIKGAEDIEKAKVEIPKMFKAGITSIAIDASHLPDAENLLACIELVKVVPSWAGLEVEVGEIKGKEGLSTVDEALFLVQGLNAYDIHPEWIALNNGTTHGIEVSGGGIQIDLTADIHKALEPYGVNGAQHGTSGNSFDKLRTIAAETNTTKANVATALMMISWGVSVNEYGNAEVDADKEFIKLAGKGMTEELWAEMVAYAKANDWSGGNYKKLCLPFEVQTLNQPVEIIERMAKDVADFAYIMLSEVFNATDTASLAIDAILAAGSYDLGFNSERIEDPADWTNDKIYAKAELLVSNEGPEGDFDD